MPINDEAVLNFCRRLAGLYRESVKDYQRFGLADTLGARIATALYQMYRGITERVEYDGRPLAEEVGLRLLAIRTDIKRGADESLAWRLVAASVVEELEELQAVLSGEGGGDAGHD